MNAEHRLVNNKQFLALITSGDMRDPFHTHMQASDAARVCVRARV